MARVASPRSPGAKDQPLPTSINGNSKSDKDRSTILRRKLILNEMNPIADALLTLLIMMCSPFLAFCAFMHDKLMFKFLNRTYIYNMSWEDPRMDHRVMKLSEKDHVVTIASAGCNALDYVIEGAKVTAVDFNMCQIALTELKKVAIINCTFEEFFDIFSNSNMELLRSIYNDRLRPHLTAPSAEFWDDGVYSIKSFMYSGTSGGMSYFLFRILFPLFGLGFIRDELLKGTTTKEELCRMIGEKSYSVRSLAWMLDNLMLRGGCCFAGVPERQMSLGMHRPNNIALVFERVFFKSDILNDNYFYSGYILGKYLPHNCPRYLRKEHFDTLKKNLTAGKLVLYHGTMLDAIDAAKTPITVASLLDHMDWMTDRAIQEEITHLIKKMDPVRGKIFWRTFADDVHSAPLLWLDPIRVGHADDEDSDDRVAMYWTTWIAHLKDVKVGFAERVTVDQSKGFCEDLMTGVKIVTFPFWKPFISATLKEQGHAKDMESFYKYQKDGYDAFRENLLHARPILMENFKLDKKGGMVWVDVGGGTARNLEYFPPEVIRKYFKKIYIVDISASLLEVASRRVELMGLSDIVQIVEFDFTNEAVFKLLPSLGTVDAVTMSYSFSMIPAQSTCMKHITQLLKPGTGFVSIADFFMKGNYDDFLPGLQRHIRQLESYFQKAWFAMDHVYLLHDADLDFAGLDKVWDNRFRGGVPFFPFLQPYHGVITYKRGTR
jgi:betaine lipid synthase